MTEQRIDDMLTTEEVAAIFRTTPATWHSRKHRGQPMPEGIRFGRRVLYRRSAVEAFIAAQRETA